MSQLEECTKGNDFMSLYQRHTSGSRHWQTQHFQHLNNELQRINKRTLAMLLSRALFSFGLDFDRLDITEGFLHIHNMSDGNGQFTK